MEPTLSKKSLMFKKTISPVRQIMSYASPSYFKKIGLDPSSVISFSGGWVNHNAPEQLREAYLEIVQDNKLFHESGGYSPTLGMLECKEALVKYEKHIHNITKLQPTQIAIGANSTQLTYDLLKVLLDPGDKILLLDPSYCNFPSQLVSALDVEIIRFPVIDTDSWKYIAEERIALFVETIIKEKPKVILLVSPDNPTSQVLSDAFVEAALKAAKEIGGFLLIDFAYKDIVFLEELPKYYSWEPNENYLSIHSNSKWIRGLGRRLGWIEAPESVIEALESIQCSSVLCPDTLHQMALSRFIEKSIKENILKSYINEVKDKYKKAAEYTISSINKYLNLPYLIPQGGLYTCIKVGFDGAKFVEKVIEEKGVIFVPGWGFGRTMTDAIRVSYGPLVNNLNLIDEGFLRTSQVLNKKES
ncbi:pyridoxal phosphate-dependent aminotransferase [Candidatus Pacearchaeota archaeon]|nr:pyridoxal phosphate-dependent aminotransferase [Candidatus Pacearchaeota archaeon]